MTLPIERATTRRRVTWLTVIGVILLPVLIGGVLVAALWNPTERLDNIRAAIVNEDSPVTLNGQTVPLGRQLTAGLVEGSDDVDSNIDWVISNADDAKSGLADGTYDAAITIPENFSAAATSTAGDNPEQAKIEVTTSPDAKVFDATITNQIATIASGSMGEMLSKNYLENVLLGFTTLNEQLGTAADGATELADGTRQSADGTRQLADGATTLADGIGQLDSGAQQLSSGAATAADGTHQLADGAGQLASGLNQLAPGATQLADGAAASATGAQGLAQGAGQLTEGLSALAPGARGIATGASDLSGGVKTYTDGVSAVLGALPQISAGAGQLRDGIGTLADEIRANAETMRSSALLPDELLTNASDAAATTASVATQIGDAAQTLGAAAQSCAVAHGQTDASCIALAQQAQALGALATGDATTAATQAGTASAYAQGTAQALPGTIADQLVALGDAIDTTPGPDGSPNLAQGATALASGIDTLITQAAPLDQGGKELAAGAAALASGAASVADGVDATATGASSLASGSSQLASGIQQLSDGASGLSLGLGQTQIGAGSLASGTSALADGADQLASGASALSDGVGQTADGATTLAEGTTTLADGSTKLADGSAGLADGLQDAVKQIPSYSEQQRTDLATVVANPVVTEGTGSNMFGDSAIPLLAVFALWFGGLASYIAMQARTARTLAERRPSVVLTLRALIPGALIGAVQGVLIAGVVQFVAKYDVGEWFAFAGVAALAGIAFAAVNQALVALFGGAGRWISAIVGVLFFATGVVSTTPGFLDAVAGVLPTAPAYQGLLALVTPAGGFGAALTALVIWTVLSIVVTTASIARRRFTSVRALQAGA
ncbi:YhgE/Pip domain-containing protein [Microbacterium nymphoidis]|uniref:YhgE/Pip domain-containing protein n=1 Tax=Microbacterium nymphoidis TaxID=2898586 RepID=UPI001E3581D0|nr:YhgE/Pip domain-containing protein [Microbacterium nymphoidis]MCD2498818.1 YhgE/Pip domain-containing protein [Microbacterium nymphoidis]